MPGLWEELLAPASLGGVELPIVRRMISGGRSTVRKVLPYVGGQETEDTGRLPRKIEAEIELFNDMFEDGLYPDRYEELVDVLDDENDQAVVEWFDPVWGPIMVKVVSWEAEENAQDRDGVRLRLSMEEEGFQETADGTSFTLLRQSDRARAESDAAEFDALIEELAISDDDVAEAWEEAGYPKKIGETTSFQAQVRSFTDNLDSGLQRADQVRARVASVQARVESVMQLDAARSAAGWPLLFRGARVLDEVVAIGNAVISTQARLITVTTTTPTSVFELAAQLYGDVDRATEILQGNPQRHPLFVPVGTVLEVLDR